MDKFKRGLSLHKKKDVVSESNKPYLWQEDERKVREGTCSFQVRVSITYFYLKPSFFLVNCKCCYKLLCNSCYVIVGKQGELNCPIKCITSIRMVNFL